MTGTEPGTRTGTAPNQPGAAATTARLQAAHRRATGMTLRFWEVPAFEKCLPPDSQWFMFGIGWMLIAVFVLACGWVEDVAARKKPRLIPGCGAARMGG